MTDYEREMLHAVLAELRMIRTLLLLQCDGFASPKDARTQLEQMIDQVENLRQASIEPGVAVLPEWLGRPGKACEVCRRPACCMVVDSIETTQPGDTARSFKPDRSHWFCERHQRPSVTTLPSGDTVIEQEELLGFYGIYGNLSTWKQR